MRKSLLVSLALASVLSASVALADCPCQPAPRPLRTDGPTNPHRPTTQVADGIVANPRPLIQVADSEAPKRPLLQLADNTHVPRPLLADSDMADAVLHRPLVADISPSLKRPLVADNSGLTPVRRPLIQLADGPTYPHRPTKQFDLGLPQLADGSESTKVPPVQLADVSGCTAVRRPLAA